ncbi:MAG TPA: ribbon-helix-helix domain-containing protein [Halanaerobiales bacterium]|nr:ribbon-helix-helix domain-containing protein [Halanaerobiales bacterium]
MGDNKATIKIPRNLYNNLNQIIKNSGFNSVTEFIVYVLRDLVSNHKMSDEEITESRQQLSNEEVKMIKKRLKSLGYLD